MHKLPYIYILDCNTLPSRTSTHSKSSEMKSTWMPWSTTTDIWLQSICFLWRTLNVRKHSSLQRYHLVTFNCCLQLTRAYHQTIGSGHPRWPKLEATFEGIWGAILIHHSDSEKKIAGKGRGQDGKLKTPHPWNLFEVYQIHPKSLATSTTWQHYINEKYWPFSPRNS